ncbi:MAG: hypothetical protein U0787_04035 [Polyangia bacterium]
MKRQPRVLVMDKPESIGVSRCGGSPIGSKTRNIPDGSLPTSRTDAMSALASCTISRPRAAKTRADDITPTGPIDQKDSCPRFN